MTDVGVGTVVVAAAVATDVMTPIDTADTSEITNVAMMIAVVMTAAAMTVDMTVAIEMIADMTTATMLETPSVEGMNAGNVTITMAGNGMEGATTVTDMDLVVPAVGTTVIDTTVRPSVVRQGSEKQLLGLPAMEIRVPDLRPATHMEVRNINCHNQ